jgi:hypothetical protein
MGALVNAIMTAMATNIDVIHFFITRLLKSEVSPFLRKFSDHPNYQSLKKLLVGTKNEIQFLCQYLLLFQ